MTPKLTPRAGRELDNALARIAADSPANAKHVATKLEATFGLLAFMPSMGRKSSQRHGVQQYAVPKLPFIVFYRTSSTELQILSVFHTRRSELGKGSTL